MMKLNRHILEALYRRFNRRRFVSPDPLQFLYAYDNPRDREIIALIASSLAYGRVAQIIKSVETVLASLDEPVFFIRSSSRKDIRRRFTAFKHRFSTGDELAAMLSGVKGVLDEYGSLHACFLDGLAEDDETVFPALSFLVSCLSRHAGRRFTSLLPSPSAGSACKRLNLFMRWMVRSDEVDPGGWSDVPAAKLIVPLDTHIFKIGTHFGMTKRRQMDAVTALEITRFFKRMQPDDPVRYDFALTRFGIRRDLDFSALTNWCSGRRNVPV
jgi:uncharacterized protein (TIGR02757 family)